MTKEPWKIGVIMSQSGVTGAIERNQLAATRLAIAEINAMGGILGRRVEAVFRDPKSTPALYRSHASDLCREERVQVIFGGHMSSTRKAMLPEIEAHNAVLFYPTLYEGFEYSRHCVYTGAAPNQNSVPMVDYLHANFGERMFVVGSDYVYPYESNRIVADLMRSKGGKVVDEFYVPLDLRAENVAELIARIRAHNPDMIYSTVVGDGIVPFYTAYREAGFDPATCPIASQSTSEVDVARMPPGVAEGHIIAAPFFDTLRNPGSLAFARAFRLAAGGPVAATAPAEAAYFSVHLYAAALALAGDDGIAALLPALYEVEVDAPQGAVRVDRHTNHTHLWPRVARVREGAPYDIVSHPTERVPPDPYLLSISGHQDEMEAPVFPVHATHR
ncbi:transporter substrate-binding domain-containing protein [Fertoebacter nigrum]|uniref:Transporter substrate-binding domain-containing protein n=1 Tax=Fertoeibacter niger TaxID=2656921 RepID=A0A8X8GX50_9RHOB|nr:transporter substrate-binding domain-containing protein [Fertoeibacter niger]NUB45933.1 transporter substrate-binding domain-containing protein [Fertoeibacter niger]